MTPRKWTLPLLLLLLLSGCGKPDLGVELGYSPPIIPVRISIDTHGRVSAAFSGDLHTPIGTFDLGAGGSVPALKETVKSKVLPGKHLLVVRVDGAATVYELEPKKRFNIESVSQQGGYRKVGVTEDANGDIILELESMPQEGGNKPGLAGPAAVKIGAAACPRAEACIQSPASGSQLAGTVTFSGTATRPGFKYYKFELWSEARQEWCYVAHFESPVSNGVLMEWNTAAVAPGTYRLRLRVVDDGGNYWPQDAEVQVRVGR